MIHQNPLPVHFYLKLVKDSIEELLELPEVLQLACIWVVVTTYQDDLTMQQAYEMLYGREPTTLIAEIAQVEHDGIFRHCIVPVVD